MKTPLRLLLPCLALLATAPAVAQQTDPAAAGPRWTPLFNGHDTTGWEHVGDGGFTIEDGVLKTEGGMGLLWYTPRKFRDVVLRVVYRNPEGSNAGVFIRIPDPPEDAWYAVNHGYEVQIDDRVEDPTTTTGALYSLVPVMARAGRPGEWNTMEVFLDGDRTVVTVNGRLVTYFREGDPVRERREEWEPIRGPRPVEGFIGVQNHGPDDIVYFREISVRPLRP